MSLQHCGHSWGSKMPIISENPTFSTLWTSLHWSCCLFRVQHARVLIRFEVRNYHSESSGSTLTSGKNDVRRLANQDPTLRHGEHCYIQT